MKIIYVTDLHGATWKYEKVLKAAKKHGCKAIVNGADMFPKGQQIDQQDVFIEKFLDKHFGECSAAGVAYLCMPGNDDLMIFDNLFSKVCSKHENIFNIAQQKVALEGYEFIGFNWVVDYPFRLKDRCRMDDKDYVFGMQYGPGCLSEVGGWKDILDWPEYARKLPTIKDELASLPIPDNARKAVYVIHMPPSGLGLDLCGNGQCVGSKSVRLFLEKMEPLFSLHGHIHESPEQVGGRWKSPLGNTTCIQPGQMAKTCYVIIDLDLGTAERILEYKHEEANF